MSKRKQGRTVIVTCKRCGDEVKSSEAHIITGEDGAKALLCGGCYRLWIWDGLTGKDERRKW